MVIPKGSEILNLPISGYEIYLDTEGKMLFKKDEWDDLSDLTVYYIKTDSWHLWECDTIARYYFATKKSKKTEYSLEYVENTESK